MDDQGKRDWVPERQAGAFNLKSPFTPRGDQPAAIRSLNEGLSSQVRLEFDPTADVAN